MFIIKLEKGILIAGITDYRLSNFVGKQIEFKTKIMRKKYNMEVNYKFKFAHLD